MDGVHRRTAGYPEMGKRPKIIDRLKYIESKGN